MVGENVFRWLERMYLDGWRECIQMVGENVFRWLDRMYLDGWRECI